MLYSLDDLGPLAAGFTGHAAFERESGLPWSSTVGELAVSYGVTRWRGFQDVVPIPPAFGLDVAFRHRFDPARNHYPAHDFQAELNPLGDHLRNHAWAIETLARRFRRQPVNADVSNCLGAIWDFGLFEVSLRSFIREKSRFGRNVLYDKHPDLWQCTNLTVECRACACREVETALRFANGFDLKDSDARIGPGDFLTNRLIAPGLVSRTRVWQDGDRVGTANRWASIIRPRAGELVLEVRTPARGGGSSSLTLGGVTLLQGRRWDGLDDLAGRVAGLFALPLVRSTVPDE